MMKAQNKGQKCSNHHLSGYGMHIIYSLTSSKGLDWAGKTQFLRKLNLASIL